MVDLNRVVRASDIIANGSRDDGYANHAELREGFGGTFPEGITDRQIDVIIAAYGEPGVGALNAQQLQRAMDHRVLAFDGNGQLAIDFNQQEVSGALADAAVSHGSSDDRLVNHTELRSGFEALGFDVPFTERMAYVLFQGYGGPDATAIGRDDIKRALDEGALDVRGNAVNMNFGATPLAAPLARGIVAGGSRDDGLVNRGELRDGLRELGFDPRMNDDAVAGLMALYDTEAMDVDQLTQAITNGNLALDGGGGLAAQAQPVYGREIDPSAPFGAHVRGPDSRSIDRDLAAIADTVYNPSALTAGSFTRMSNADARAHGVDPALLQDDGTSFKAGLYRDEAGHVVLAFAGTEGITAGKDWWTNAKQGLGFDAKQYREAVELAAQAKMAFGEDLVVTGHSLGGGLAATASLVHDIPAVTFNAAGVNDETLRRNGLDPEHSREAAREGLIRRYVVDGEALNYAQDHLPIPDAPGRLISLADPDPLPPLTPPLSNVGLENGWDVGYAVWRAAHSGKLHLMPSVLQALDGQRPWG